MEEQVEAAMPAPVTIDYGLPHETRTTNPVDMPQEAPPGYTYRGHPEPAQGPHNWAPLGQLTGTVDTAPERRARVGEFQEPARVGDFQEPAREFVDPVPTMWQAVDYTRRPSVGIAPDPAPAKEYTTTQIAQMIWAFVRAKEYADGNYDRQEWSFANQDVTDDFVRKVRDALDSSGTVQQAILQVVDCYGGVAYKGEQE